MFLGLKEGLVKCATVCIKSVVILQYIRYPYVCCCFMMGRIWTTSRQMIRNLNMFRHPYITLNGSKLDMLNLNPGRKCKSVSLAAGFDSYTYIELNLAHWEFMSWFQPWLSCMPTGMPELSKNPQKYFTNKSVELLR